MDASGQLLAIKHEGLNNHLIDHNHRGVSVKNSPKQHRIWKASLLNFIYLQLIIIFPKIDFIAALQYNIYDVSTHILQVNFCA